MGRKRSAGGAPELASGNGLLDRRALLVGAAGGAGLAAARPAFGAAELSVEPWMKEPGAPFVGYGLPSRFEAKVFRAFASAPGTTGTGASRTPLQRLNGAITPNGLHFERHHSGIPDIDPDAHRLLIHGLVKRPLIFTLEALARYPMETRIAFIECGGNTGALYQKEPAQLDLQASHGLYPASSGPGSGSRSCSTKLESSRKRGGSSPKGPTPPA
jgi:sulfane dehydrogenase subunit SoxC